MATLDRTKGGKDLLGAMRIVRFVPLDAAALAAARKSFAAAAAVFSAARKSFAAAAADLSTAQKSFAATPAKSWSR